MLDVCEVLEVPEVMCCMLFCMLKAVEGRNRRCWTCGTCVLMAAKEGRGAIVRVLPAISLA